MGKADGAWFLHKHSKDKDKELAGFILYSSVASLFGNIGQANYSAANAYLDELARWRVGRRLPGVSIQWPAVSGVGMAAAMDERVRIDDAKLSVGVQKVKQVVTQVLGMNPTSTASAVQAVVPRGLLEEGVLSGTTAPLVQSVQVCKRDLPNGCLKVNHFVRISRWLLPTFRSSQRPAHQHEPSELEERSE